MRYVKGWDDGLFESEEYRFFLRRHENGTANAIVLMPKVWETVEYFMKNKKLKLEDINYEVKDVNVKVDRAGTHEITILLQESDQ